MILCFKEKKKEGKESFASFEAANQPDTNILKAISIQFSIKIKQCSKAKVENKFILYSNITGMYSDQEYSSTLFDLYSNSTQGC